MSKGLDPWSNTNPTATTSTLHYLLQEKERAQAQEQLQIYHQQGFSSYLQHHHHHRRQQQSRAGAAGGDGVSSGESTPVDAQLATAFGSGRIVRSAAGRKDRHSKVCTARGLRDRRVRLAAHTAIRFYDVQDRLGYDRPSKAVDWLIRHAKNSIDELPDRAEAPPPATAEAAAADASAEQAEQQVTTSTSSYGFGNAIGGVAGGSFIPHSVGGDGGVHGSNVKSLFPSSSTTASTTAAAGHHDEYRGSPPDLLSRTTSCSQQPQELCLTLQSNQHHQIFSHHQNHHQGMISGAGGGWPTERMPSWHASESGGAGDGGRGNGDGGYMFAVQQQARQGLEHHHHQSQLFSQGGEPLQSSGGWASSARTWLDPLAAIHQPSAMAGQVGFSHLVGAGTGGFMGFLAPAVAHQRLQDEEDQGGEPMRE